MIVHTSQSIFNSSCLNSGAEANVAKGLFKNYVDKMRLVGGPKMPIFVYIQDKKCAHRGRYLGVQKMVKIMPTYSPPRMFGVGQ